VVEAPSPTFPASVSGMLKIDGALTGCTVVLCEDGAVGGVDQRGGAPGTRETDLLRPMHLVERVHAVLLAGGSAFGLDAAGGVMRYLEERKVGFDTPVSPMCPSCRPPSSLTSRWVRPACAPTRRWATGLPQRPSEPPAEGNAGAGTGATVGKILGMGQAMKGGMGTASLEWAAGSSWAPSSP
jgi:L-aminopeptidase/D-esterase-like protein